MKHFLKYTFWAAFLTLPLFLTAQDGSATDLPEKDKYKFDNHFYEAQRYKQIERFDLALENFLACAKIDPTNATVPYEIGRLYKKTGKPTEAFAYLEKAHNLDKTNIWITLELAAYQKEFGMLDEATKLFEELATANPEELAHHYELAQLYFSSGKYKECLKQLNLIEAQVGPNEELSAQKKDIYLMLNDLEGAERELQKLSDAYPENIEYLGMLAQFYVGNEMPEKAIACYTKMIALDPTDPRAHLDLANMYRQQNDLAKSYEHLKIAMASPNLPVDNKIQVLYSFYQLSERDTSLEKMGFELLEISIAATPAEPKLYAMRADYFARAGKLMESRNALRKATRLGANQVQIWSQLLLMDAELNLNDSLAADGEVFIELYPIQPMGYLMGGTGYLLTEQYQKGIDLLEAGLDFVMDNPQLEEQFYTSLADGYHRLNDHRKSDMYFDKAMEINPRNPTVLNNYAYYLSVRGVQLEKALEMTETCNRLVPNNAVFLDTWAWVLYKKGNYALALEKIEKCLSLGGAESGEVLDHYGDILFKLGRTDDAVAQWTKAASKSDAPQGIDQKIKDKKIYE
jgi:tetratricopeptide (TPR) repeat protein